MPSPHIFPSGGLLTHQFVEAIQQPSFSHPALAPDTFTLPGRKAPAPAELERAIGSAWELLVERWDGVERDLPEMDISTLRDRWVRPLLFLLDFNLEYNRADVVLEGDLRFPFSHFAVPLDKAFRVPFHSALPTGADSAASLDARRDGSKALRRLGPHDLMQRFLNLSRDSQWGMVTDGLRLRLLRDYHHSYTRGYVEFDLQGIFSERDFAAFRALYRLCHASRFLPAAVAEPAPAPAKGRAAQTTRRKTQEKAIRELPEEEYEEEEIAPEEEPAPAALSPLESFYQHALSTGVKVGEDLRSSVRAAIEGFGNGFLAATPGLTAHIQSGEVPVAGYFDDILHVIYRILFLLFAEQRGMFPGRGSLYMDEYSLTALRSLAEHAGGEDHHTDLWERLKVTFRLVEGGSDALGVYGYNGALFSPAKTPILAGGGEHEPILRNDALLRVIKKLTTVERDGGLQRISYADLSVEEIGSVYESLLDYTPRISTVAEVVEGREVAPGMFYLDPRGKARKTSGSYYTHPALVNELIKSALLPVLADRLIAAVPAFDADHPERLTAEERRAAEAALLAMKVIDPAAGSGAFLIAANNTLALRLAQIRTGDSFPAEREIRKARRDVLANCLYAVDLNPMAIELCKLSLWINAVVEDQKLNFLDHHIRPGNSLVGAFHRLVAKGIPDAAYGGAAGDDPRLAKSMRQLNQQEQAGQRSAWRVTEFHAAEDLHAYAELTRLAQSDPQAAEQRYHELREITGQSGERLAFDLWTAAFFWPLPAEGNGQSLAERARAGITPKPSERETPLPPTSHDVFQALANPRGVDARMQAYARQLRDEIHFFHWELEFPEVFGPQGSGGFDVVLGNPPWEKINLKDVEYFKHINKDIAKAATKAARKKAIKNLLMSEPQTYWAYVREQANHDRLSNYFRVSERFPLTGVSRINLFSIFTELATEIVSTKGRCGLVVASGIVTDDNNKMLFDELIRSKRLVSVWDFENRKGFFPDVDSRYKFCLFCAGGNESNIDSPLFSFFLIDTDQLLNPSNIYSLSTNDLALINPLSRTCPTFRTSVDAELAKKIYQNAPAWCIQESNGWPGNPKTPFNMSNDSGLFITIEDAIQLGLLKNKLGEYYNNNLVYYPLYESKIIHQFNHRYSTFKGLSVEDRKKGNSVEILPTNLADPSVFFEGRYWLSQELLDERFPGNWYLVYRMITNATNERTSVFTIIPKRPCSNSLSIIVETNAIQTAIICANLNSLPFDYCARQKIAGVNFNHWILKQLPIIPVNAYSSLAQEIILADVLVLTWTAWDIKSYIDDLWKELNPELRNSIQKRWLSIDRTHHSVSPNTDSLIMAPFKWDEEHRAYLRAELDGLYAHLYGLTRDEFAYILDTFPIVRRKDEAKFGEYRTKRLCLEAYDRLVGSDLIPPEARALQQQSVLAAGAAPAAPVEPGRAAAQPPAAQALPEREPARPTAGKSPQPAPAEAKPTPAAPPQGQPRLTDFGLYKCLGCGRMVLGYDRANHTRKEHQGIAPEWKKMGK